MPTRNAQRTTRPAVQAVPAPGRPRSDDAQAAILDAAIDLTREVGFDALAMEAIARRAGVGKSTVYRWWTTKEALIAEALARFARAIPVPDTGSVDADLMVILRGTMRMYQDPATRLLLPALIAAMARSKMVAAAVRSGFVAARRDAMRIVLERAIARREIPADTPVPVALDLLSGPLLYRSLVMGAPINETMVAAVLGVVLRGLRAGPTVIR